MTTDRNTASAIHAFIPGLLGIAFVVLKLCHVIDWSWWWVTAPFWGPLVLVIAIAVPVIVVCHVIDKRRRTR